MGNSEPAPVRIHRYGHLYVRLPKSTLNGAKAEMVIDPNIQFGAPIIKGTRLTLEALAARVLAGESIGTVAASHRISEDAVREAVEYVSAPRGRKVKEKTNGRHE